MFRSRIIIRTPPAFMFWPTVWSHGWCLLTPFSCQQEARTLSRCLELSDGAIVSCVIAGNRHSITVHTESARSMSPSQRAEIAGQIRSCLRLEEDLSGLYRMVRRYPEYRWIADIKAGRMLRSPTVFEDVVKMICTTNCSWGLTELMVGNLVRHFGRAASGIGRTFPSPEAVAGSGERYLRTEIKVGYRAPYLLALAQNIASGKLNVESWRTSRRETRDMYGEILSVRGVGPYAAGNLLKLLGRYEYLGLDTWVRTQYYNLHHRGRKVKDSTIEKHYEKFGNWRGLLFWLEMTRPWHTE